MRKIATLFFFLASALTGFAQGVTLSGQYDFSTRSFDPNFDLFISIPIGTDFALMPSIGFFGTGTSREGQEYTVRNEYESTWHFKETIATQSVELPVSLYFRYEIPLKKDRTSAIGLYAGPSVYVGLMSKTNYSYTKGQFVDDAPANSKEIPVDREINLYESDPPLKRFDMRVSAGAFYMSTLIEIFVEYQHGFSDRSALAIEGKTANAIRAGVRLDYHRMKKFLEKDF